ncbi:MAG: hypothetical protein ACLR5T_04885 [Veillonella sp.]
MKRNVKLRPSRSGTKRAEARKLKLRVKRRVKLKSRLEAEHVERRSRKAEAARLEAQRELNRNDSATPCRRSSYCAEAKRAKKC